MVWPSEHRQDLLHQYADVLYRGSTKSDNGTVAIYDYKTQHPDNILHAARSNPCSLDIKTYTFGVQNYLESLTPQEQNTSAVVLAGNSGLPGGAVGRHMFVDKNVKTSGQLFNSPKSGNGTYGTQEEDVVKNWLLSENAQNKKSIFASMGLVFGSYGMTTYPSTDPHTKQGVNYTNLTESHSKLLKARALVPGPFERFYADAIVVRDQLLRPKNSRKPDTYKNIFMKTHLVFVAGPNVGSNGTNGTSTTRRTFNKHLANNFPNFAEGVKWTYFAALHAIAMNGKRVALLPWISGDLYAGPFIALYGVKSDGKMLRSILECVLSIPCMIKGEWNTLRYAFDKVIVVSL